MTWCSTCRKSLPGRALLSIPILLWSPIGRKVISFTVPPQSGLRDDVFFLIISLPVIFYSTWIFFDGAWRALRARTLDMMVLVAVAIGAGWLYSVYVDVAGQLVARIADRATRDVRGARSRMGGTDLALWASHVAARNRAGTQRRTLSGLQVDGPDRRRTALGGRVLRRRPRRLARPEGDGAAAGRGLVPRCSRSRPRYVQLQALSSSSASGRPSRPRRLAICDALAIQSSEGNLTSSITAMHTSGSSGCGG
jgi:hypothetical protein